MKAKKSGLGKSYRKGISLIEVVQKFSDEQKANDWFVERRWPKGIRCAYCESYNVTARTSKRKTPQYRCGGCKGIFTVKTGTIMHDSKLPLSKWAIAFYLFSQEPKGRIQHEATPRPWHYPKGGMAHGTPHTGNLGH